MRKYGKGWWRGMVGEGGEIEAEGRADVGLIGLSPSLFLILAEYHSFETVLLSCVLYY